MSGPVIRVMHGDSLDLLATLPEASVSAVVTDPPYGLVFMGKAWDNHVSPTGFQDWCQRWVAECLRVLKPGGHLLAFGGTRTYHRLTCAIEDAGFEIRDSITWVYGSGFPKSLDVSKAIDKAAGVEFSARPAEGVGFMRPDGRGGYNVTQNQLTREGESTSDAERWQGWGTALKPATEPIVVARKPLSAPAVAANVLAYGTGAINIDGCRVGTGDNLGRPQGTMPQPMDWGNRSPGEKLVTVGNPSGRWPANLVLTHAPDCVEVGTRRVRNPSGSVSGSEPSHSGGGGIYSEIGRVPFVAHADADGMETVAAFDCAEGCPVAEMDAQSGPAGSNSGRPNRADGQRSVVGEIFSRGPQGSASTYDTRGTGGASRFFPVFRYQAKAPTRERPKVEGAPAHPTVKPLALMRWLVRLVTPPGGIVLDPFTGSGTTLEAAVLEGFHCIGIERESEYLPLIEERLRRAREAQA